MEIKLTDDQVKAAVAGAVASLMTGEQRAALIEKAIASLLTEKEKGYPNRTMMQVHFEEAIAKWVKKEIEKQLSTDKTMQERVSSVVQEATHKALTGEGRTKLVIALSRAIESSLSPDRSY